MKFLTDFTYRHLHGFARFPGYSTALVNILDGLRATATGVDQLLDGQTDRFTITKTVQRIASHGKNGGYWIRPRFSVSEYFLVECDITSERQIAGHLD